MKTINVLFFILFYCSIISAQTDTTPYTYEALNTPSFFRQLKNNLNVTSYEAKDGTLWKVGDIVTIGNPFEKGGYYHSYITLGTNASALLFGDFDYATIDHFGYELEIISIILARDGLSKKNPFYATAAFHRKGGGKILGSKLGRFDIELAVQAQEIHHPNRPITREEAVALLKQLNEEYALGIYMEEEYLATKEELIRIIKN